MIEFAEDPVATALERAASLKMFPKVAMEVQSLMGRPETTLADLELAIGHDPALVGQILRYANSPFYGVSGKVSTLKRAVQVLGFREVRTAVVTLSMASLGKPDGPGRKALWGHSVLVGLVARHLGRHIREVDSQQAFVCGVMHDLGSRILLEIDEETTLGIQKRFESEDARLQAEKRSFGVDHATLGAACMKAWGLPPDECEAVAQHHDPETTTRFIEGEGPALPAFIQLCEYLAGDFDVPISTLTDRVLAHPFAKKIGLRRVNVEAGLEIACEDLDEWNVR